jgi:hypothetical protein
MISTFAKYAWNFLMSMISKDKDLQKNEKERINKKIRSKEC